MPHNFTSGSQELKPYNISQGEEIQVVVEFDWSNDNLPRDWSVVAYAKNGTVHIWHKSGMMTQNMTAVYDGDSAIEAGANKYVNTYHPLPEPENYADIT